jgi:hypothetical protein
MLEEKAVKCPVCNSQKIIQGRHKIHPFKGNSALPMPRMQLQIFITIAIWTVVGGDITRKTPFFPYGVALLIMGK